MMPNQPGDAHFRGPASREAKRTKPAIAVTPMPLEHAPARRGPSLAKWKQFLVGTVSVYAWAAANVGLVAVVPEAAFGWAVAATTLVFFVSLLVVRAKTGWVALIPGVLGAFLLIPLIAAIACGVVVAKGGVPFSH